MTWGTVRLPSDLRRATSPPVWPHKTSPTLATRFTYIAHSGPAHRTGRICSTQAFRGSDWASSRTVTAPSGFASYLPRRTEISWKSTEQVKRGSRHLSDAARRNGPNSAQGVSTEVARSIYGCAPKSCPVGGFGMNRKYDPVPGGLMLTVKRTLPIALTILAGCLWQRPAEAQNKTFYMDRAQISGAPDDGYMVWRPYLHEKTRFYGMLSLGYSHAPLRIAAATSEPGVINSWNDLVKGQLITYMNVGTEVAGWFSFNLSQPILLYGMYGETPNPPPEQGEPDFNASEKQAFHDTRVDLRVKLLTSQDRKTRLGVGASVFLKTGNSAGALAGDEATTTYFHLAAEHNFGDWLLAGNIGPHLRPQRGLTDRRER